MTWYCVDAGAGVAGVERLDALIADFRAWTIDEAMAGDSNIQLAAMFASIGPVGDSYAYFTPAAGGFARTVADAIPCETPTRSPKLSLCVAVNQAMAYEQLAVE